MADFNNGLSINGPLSLADAKASSYHFGTVVDVVIYDPSDDYEAGAWRKKCQDKSWYTEALGGDFWVGRQASIAEAWAACKGILGGVFQATATAGPLTSGKYYAATSATTATEVFRGVSREFPAVVGIVAESARVVIYDLTAPGCPMWYVVANTSTTVALSAFGGLVCVGRTSNLVILNFPSDSIAFKGSGQDQLSKSALGSVAVHTFTAIATLLPTTYGLGYIVNSTVNDVTITTLDNAPIDPATGLPVPTIAVATAGGVSVIKDDGTVVNSSSAGSFAEVSFNGSILSYCLSTSPQWAIKSVVNLGAAWASEQAYINGSVPALLALSNSSTYRIQALANDAAGNTLGVTKLKRNPASATVGMLAYLTSTYNSGWMVGDIRGAFLADTVAETITGSGELVTNGTFAANTSGWTASNAGTTLSWNAGVARATGDGSNYVSAYTSFPTVAGETYVISFNVVTLPASLTVRMNLDGISFNGAGIVNGGAVTSAVGPSIPFTFVATSTTTWVLLRNNGNFVEFFEFDNVSCKLAELDRSVKNIGLAITGSLTKSPVASGANLVAYSGFTAANYLEQSPSSALDFAAGDFCVMGWAVVSATAGYIFFRNPSGTDVGTTRMFCAVAAGGYLSFKINATQITSPLTYSGLVFITCSRVSGVMRLSVNNVEVATAAETSNITDVTAVLRFGVSTAGASVFTGSLALWRFSSTVPTSSQLAHIYQTELPLFQPNAKCTIDGTSTSVTALAHDRSTDLLHVGTSWGRSVFKDLVRIDSVAGAVSSVSAAYSRVLADGSMYSPNITLTDELTKKLNTVTPKLERVFDYTATASQTAFVLPKGWTAKCLEKNGTKVRETTTGVYWTRSNDGFQETCTLSVGATVSDWISITAVRT